MFPFCQQASSQLPATLTFPSMGRLLLCLTLAIWEGKGLPKWWISWTSYAPSAPVLWEHFLGSRLCQGQQARRPALHEA